MSASSTTAEQPPIFEIPALVIFDKDGTLIDFHAMWSGWIEQVAHGLSAAAGQPLAEVYLAYVGYDGAARRTLPGGRLAQLPMATLYTLTEQFLAGLEIGDPKAVVAAAWTYPDPIRDAHPITDLSQLFGAMQALGCRLTVATTDDHAPAVATLSNLGVLGYIEHIVGADDGVPIKPEPDMVRHLCELTGLPPNRTVVVGDSLDDMRMAKAAGALAIGVLTGITPAAQLGTVADHLLEGVAQLPALFRPV